MSQISIGGDVRGKEVLYFVQDNGLGIDPCYHQRIFGLFERLDHTKGGTGVGWTIVSRLMEMHGGRVWVESKPGAGATFWLAFPKPHGENASLEPGGK